VGRQKFVVRRIVLAICRCWPTQKITAVRTWNSYWVAPRFETGALDAFDGARDGKIVEISRLGFIGMIPQLLRCYTSGREIITQCNERLLIFDSLAVREFFPSKDQIAGHAAGI